MGNDTLKNGGADPQYKETTAPQNPPESMVRPEARSAWLLSSVGIVVTVAVIVGAALVFMTARRALDDEPVIRPEPTTIGTSGERQPREGTAGGFNPSPRPGSTKEELELRGAGEGPQGLGLTGPVTRLTDVAAAAQTSGQRVEIRDVQVDHAEGSTFWIRDGNTTVMVVTAGGVPTVKAGQNVDVAGTIEGSGANARIRASRIDVK